MRREDQGTPPEILRAVSGLINPGETLDIQRLRDENYDLRRENRELNAEYRRLVKENADLRVELAEIKARTGPKADPDEGSRRSA